MRVTLLPSVLTKAAHKLPLQSILIISFVAQIFTAVGLVGYLSFKNGQQAVNDLAGQLMDEVNSRINLQLEAYLNVPPKLNQAHVNHAELNLLNLQDTTSLERYLWYQAQEHDSIGFHIFGNAQGDYAGIERLDSGDRQIVASDLVNGYRVYGGDRQGYRTQLIRKRDGQYDPRQRPWYKAAVAAKKPTWGNIYVWFKNQKLGLPAVQPVYDKQGKLVGVFGTELALSQVSEFLQSLKLGRSGQTFIIERSGLMVASSTQEPLFEKKGKDQFERTPISKSQNALSIATSRHLQQTFGDLKQIKSTQNLKVKLNNEWQYLRVTPFQDQYGLDWLVVVVLPEKTFMAKIDENTQTTILLCLGGLAIATISGIYTARWITRPLLKLSRATEDLASQFGSAQLDSTQSIYPESESSERVSAITAATWEERVKGEGCQEISGLARSFNRMAHHLQTSFTTLEQTNEQLEERVESRTGELKSALQELKRTQIQMVQSEKMSSLGQLVAGIAHEINNPVNFIHGNIHYVDEYTKTLLDIIDRYQTETSPLADLKTYVDDTDLEFLTADLAKLLSSMKVGTDRIREIVLSLRNFSRLDEAELKLADIHEGIESTLLILQHRLNTDASAINANAINANATDANATDANRTNTKQPKIHLVRDYAELPKLKCYAGQLNQVFMNVLNNAIDALEEVKTFTDNTEDQALPTITIRTSVNHQTVNANTKNWVEIAIADNGIGMSEETLQHIFDPFFTTKPVGKGTGMGMSVCYQIITKTHAGKINCSSTPNVGTEVVIQLPY
jgi:signal transduction histidine kinase